MQRVEDREPVRDAHDRFAVEVKERALSSTAVLARRPAVRVPCSRGRILAESGMPIFGRAVFAASGFRLSLKSLAPWEALFAVRRRLR
jgi:hypothetical protein